MDTYTPANINTYISANMHPVVSNNALLILLPVFFLKSLQISTEVLWNTNPICFSFSPGLLLC